MYLISSIIAEVDATIESSCCIHDGSGTQNKSCASVEHKFAAIVRAKLRAIAIRANDKPFLMVTELINKCKKKILNEIKTYESA